jgi:hypothetical protein
MLGGRMDDKPKKQLPEGKVQVTLYFDEGVRKQLKVMAAEKGKTMTEIVEAFVVAGLKKQTKREG